MLIKNIIKPVNGIDIHCKVYLPSEENENATWIVMLHQGLGSIPQWKEFPDKLFKTFNLPILMYERIGYGDTGNIQNVLPDNFLETEAFTILPELLKVFQITTYYLFGHSDGATISLLYASTKPQGLKGIIALTPHVFVEEITVKGIKKLVNNYEKGILNFFLSRYHYEKTDLLIQRWTNIWLSERMLAWNMFNELTQLEAPVLTIQGTNDEFGSIKQLEYIAKNCPSPTQHVIVEKCRHNPHLEYGSIVLQEMRNIISV